MATDKKFWKMIWRGAFSKGSLGREGYDLNDIIMRRIS